jgi:YVTN family beta-propeller protein
VAVTPDGARVYVANLGSDTVSVMDTHTNQVVASVPVGHFPADVAASPDGHRAYVTNRGSNSLSVIDTTTNQVIATVPVGLLPARVAVSPNGHRIYVTASAPDGWGGYATYPVADVIDATTNQVMGIINVDPWGLYSLSGGVAISPDGNWIYVTNPDSNHVSAISVDNRVMTSVVVSTFPQNLALSPDGARLYVTSKPRRAVDVIDTATLQVLGTVNVPNSLP